MDPFTLALATFGVQKLRGKSTRTALKDAALVGGVTYGAGKFGGIETFQKPAFSSLGLGSAGAGVTAGRDLAVQQSGQVAGTTQKGFLQKLLGERAKKDAAGNIIKEGSGFRGLGTGEKLFLGTTALSLLPEDVEEFKPPFSEEDYKREYAQQSEKLKGKFEPVDTAVAKPTMAEVTGSNMFYANQGGLATMLPKYNQGGVNYLPSKIDHDENDVNNYVRATGYVEDGAGAGDKDEDTMLAQLADGEFVSRADAVLGAGILSGADPKNFKGMRKAGADFFYNQQKQLKRIYDITNGSKKN